MKAKLTVEYAGENFSGWQTQNGQRTIQGELENALSTVVKSAAKKNGKELESARILITGSGRTDAGVHARGQVASFEWPEGLPWDPNAIQLSLNGLTPNEIVIRRLESAESDFDARHSPHVKCYRYHFLCRFEREGLYAHRAWAVGPLLNIPGMIRCARTLVGTHDFNAFRASDCTAKTSVRTILISEVTRVGDEELVLTMCGKGFLKQMIRTIAGTLLDVGRGKITEQDFESILLGLNRDRAGLTAPPGGLVLEWVAYEKDPYYS